MVEKIMSNVRYVDGKPDMQGLGVDNTGWNPMFTCPMYEQCNEKFEAIREKNKNLLHPPRVPQICYHGDLADIMEDAWKRFGAAGQLLRVGCDEKRMPYIEGKESPDEVLKMQEDGRKYWEEADKEFEKRVPAKQGS